MENRFGRTINHFFRKCPKWAQLEFAFRVLEWSFSLIRSCLLKSVSALSLASHAPDSAPAPRHNMSTIQMMGASTKGRGTAAASCNRDKFASFFAVADKNKKNIWAKPTKNWSKIGNTVGSSRCGTVGRWVFFFFSFVHFGLENGGLTAAFEATRWQCHLATTLLAVMTALQGVPLEFLPEQLLAIIWSAARAVSPGITALPLEKRTSPVGLGLGLGLGTGTHSSAIVGPASTCDYYHQFCAGRVSDDCSRERKPGNISTYPRCSSGACYCFSQPLGGWLQWLQSFNYTRTKIIGNLPYYFTWVTLPRKSTMKWCAYLTSDIFEAM